MKSKYVLYQSNDINELMSKINADLDNWEPIGDIIIEVVSYKINNETEYKRVAEVYLSRPVKMFATKSVYYQKMKRVNNE